MENKIPAVRALLAVLTPKIMRCTEPLSIRAVRDCLYGLQGTRETLFLSFLQRQIRSADLRKCTVQELFSFRRNLVLSFDMLKNTPKTSIKKWEIINNLIAAEISTRKNSENSENIGNNENNENGEECSLRSVNEERMFRVAEKLFEDFGYELSSNSLILDLFPGNFVVKIPINNPYKIDYILINIEIDNEINGIVSKEKKKRFLQLRDDYIRSKGIFIIRMKHLKISNMTDNDIVLWLNESVSDILKSVNHAFSPKVIRVEKPYIASEINEEEEN